MLKSKLLSACLALILCLNAAGCTADPGDTTSMQTAPSPAPDQKAAAIQEDSFEVIAWVDNPTPAQGEKINLSGHLIKNGVYLGGMMMTASWPDKEQERGVPNCKVLVIYQRGICIIATDNFSPGEYVPVTVKFVYQDRAYSGETGFTVK